MQTVRVCWVESTTNASFTFIYFTTFQMKLFVECDNFAQFKFSSKNSPFGRAAFGWGISHQPPSQIISISRREAVLRTNGAHDEPGRGVLIGVGHFQ